MGTRNPTPAKTPEVSSLSSQFLCGSKIFRFSEVKTDALNFGTGKGLFGPSKAEACVKNKMNKRNVYIYTVHILYGGFLKIAAGPQIGWFIWKTLLTWMIWGVPPFKETSI